MCRHAYIRNRTTASKPLDQDWIRIDNYFQTSLEGSPPPSKAGSPPEDLKQAPEQAASGEPTDAMPAGSSDAVPTTDGLCVRFPDEVKAESITSALVTPVRPGLDGAAVTPTTEQSAERHRHAAREMGLAMIQVGTPCHPAIRDSPTSR